MRWLTADNRLLKESEITDEHLKNIIRHVKQYEFAYPSSVLRRVVGWAAKRRIDANALSPPPIPWLDERDGKWKTFDPIVNGYVEVKAHENNNPSSAK